MDNITQEQIDALIEFIDNTEEPASITNVMAAAILAFLNLKVRQMVTVDDLNNEATARENADSLLLGLIDALNQTAVRYSDVGEIVPELAQGTSMLALNQSPLVLFKGMGEEYDGVSRIITLSEGEAAYGGSGSYFMYNSRGTVGDYPLTANKVYFNSYTGRLYKWTGTAFEAIGGGMDAAIYEIIKSNVNLVAAKLDSLISAMAMLAFSGTVDKNTLKVGTLSWIEPETHTPRLVSPVANSTIDCGTAYEDEYDIQKTIYIQGADLTNGLTLAITEGSQNFSLAGGSSSVSKNDALAGTNITVIYTSSSSVAEATGKLRIFGGGVDVTVNLRGTYSEQGGGGGDTPTPSGYVQDGLVLHLDCQQSGNTTNHWIDLINGVDFELSNVTVGLDGGMVFSTGKYGIADGIEEGVALGVPYTEGTIEVVVKNFSFANKATPFKSAEEGGIAFSAWNYGNPLVTGFVMACSMITATQTKVLKNDSISDGDTISGYFGMNQSRAVVNGVTVGDSPNQDGYVLSSENAACSFSSQNESGKIVLGRSQNSYNTSAWMSGTIYAVRVYSRQLSDAEMKQNYNVDKSKYGLS